MAVISTVGHGNPGRPASDMVAPGRAKSADRADDSESIWSRAVDDDYEGPRAAGDRALHDLLLLDNLAWSNGLIHAVRTLKPRELAAAVAGYRWFGLNRLANGIESVAGEVSAIDFYTPESHHAQTLLEERAQVIFFGIEGSDLLQEAVQDRIARRPAAFATTRQPG
jgi:site-specific recombinase XerC